MKASQKFKIKVEELTFAQRFDELDKKSLPLIEKLEKEGDEYGPVVMTLFLPNALCVTAQYYDKRRAPTKPTIFGHDSDELIKMQYK